jgi:TPP-dependent pyruvate/acetoin dehydrogenase alpha subunit
MSDPGTTYRTREEIQQMRSTRDAITGIKTYLSEWGIADDAKLKAIDKAVAQAKKDAFPDLKAFWTDIYVSLYQEFIDRLSLTSISLHSTTERSHRSPEAE